MEIEWNGKDKTAKVIREKYNVEKYEDYASNVWSIANISPKCELFGGTFREDMCGDTDAPNASFYRFSQNHGVKQIWNDQGLSAGLGWNEHDNRFYHIDSCKLELREYDWDPKSSKIRNGRVVFDFGKCSKCEYYPTGLTVDTDGYVYVAMYYGSAVWKIDPRKSKVVEKIKIPAKVVSSVDFGGKHRDILFVTSGRRGFDFNTGQLTNKRYRGESGSVFMVKGLHAKGYPGRSVCF